MNVSLVKEYQIASRDEMIDIAVRHANYVQDCIQQGKTPVITNIIGLPGGGKSIFWDFGIEQLLDDPVCTEQKRDADGARLYETWIGYNRELGRELKIFVCNIRASRNADLGLDIEALERGDFDNFGDVVMLTNANQNFVVVPHLEYNLWEPVEMDRRELDWGRNVSVCMYNP